MPSDGDKYILRDGSSSNLTNARPEFDPGKVQRRRQYSQNIDSLDLLPNDRDQRGIFRKCGRRAFAFSKGFSHRADRYCVWFRPQRADLSVLEGRPAVRTASQRLDRVGRLDQQSGISGWLSTLRQTCVTAVSGMPQRGIRTVAAVREFLRPKQLSLRHHLREVSRCRPRTRAFSRFKDCRKLWNARSDRESCVTSPRPANRYLCFLSCGSRQALTPALSFRPGEALEDYVHIPYIPNAPVDVHGNQTQLLAKSRCFEGSTMTCTTCHDVHRRQRDAAAFSPHRLTCLKPETAQNFASWVELLPAIASIATCRCRNPTCSFLTPAAES